MLRATTALVFLFLVPSALGGQDTAADCVALEDPALRLACYDRLFDRQSAASPAREADGGNGTAAAATGEWLPDTTDFPRLIADPKEQQFFFSFGNLDFPAVRGDIAASLVGFGDRLGLYRFAPAADGAYWQINAVGGLFAQFDIDDFNDSDNGGDLLNADYTVGVAALRISGPHALRLKLFHESTHLGDELLIEDPEFQLRRLNYSYEALDALYAYTSGPWRAYGGGRVHLRRDPEGVQRWQLNAGLEYRGAMPLIFAAYPVAGFDLRAWNQNDWDPTISLKGGVEWRGKDTDRYLRLLVEYLDGPSPFGQFFSDNLDYLGAGLYFGF